MEKTSLILFYGSFFLINLFISARFCSSQKMYRKLLKNFSSILFLFFFDLVLCQAFTKDDKKKSFHFSASLNQKESKEVLGMLQTFLLFMKMQEILNSILIYLYIYLL